MGIEFRSAPALGEAHSQLHILHGRPSEARAVKAPKIQEDIAADGPEPGPEGLGGTGSDLMHMMV
jgi:hypothetical protein